MQSFSILTTVQNDKNEARKEKLHVAGDNAVSLPSTQATKKDEQKEKEADKQVVSASPPRAPSHDRTPSTVAQGVSEDDEDSGSPPSPGWTDSPHTFLPPPLPIDNNLTDSTKKQKVEDTMTETEKQGRSGSTLPVPWQMQFTGAFCMFCVSLFENDVCEGLVCDHNH